ncbi:MAG: TonB-dependent receptor plug domain-containing protein [Parahaliea sp.]
MALLATGGVLASALVQAQTQTQMSERGSQPMAKGEQVGLETVVVTGTYMPRAVDELTATTTVLDTQQLRQLNKRQLADVLRSVPGLLVEEQGGAGGLSAVSVRGGEANFTQVLLDGVPLNDPTNSRGGSYDLSQISSAAIERIEIVRGPQSAVYGSDALAGVINIISRDPGTVPAPQLRVELGDSGYRDYRFAAGADLAGLGVALDLGQRDGGDWVAGSERNLHNAGLHLRWRAGEAHSLSAQLRYLKGERSSYPEQSGGPRYAGSEALDRADYRDTSAALSWDAQLGGRWHSRLSGSRFEHREDYASPGIAPYQAVPPSTAETVFERRQLSWVNALDMGEHVQLNLGADYRDERGRSRGYLDYGFPLPTDFRLSRHTVGTFADLHLQLGERWWLQASARRDRPQDFDGETTLRFGARYQWLPSLALLANWGEGFKLPSFFALGHALVGNPALQAETARGWDAGLQWRPLSTLELHLTTFFNRYRNLVDFDPEAFTNVNRRQVESRGAEWQLNWQADTDVTLRAHATYTDIDVIGERARLLGRPAWKAGAWLDWRFTPGWHSGVDNAWNGAVPASSLHSGELQVTELDAYHRVDWRLGWQASPVLGLELAVDNLFGEDYDTAYGFPAPGRVLRLAANLEF